MAASVACRERQARFQGNPLTGRLLRWTIDANELQLVVELNASFEDLEQRLQTRLPSGRPCRAAGHPYAIIAVGSVEKIDPAAHAAFLAAVIDAFPIIVENATFSLTKAVIRAAANN